jgi:hypothetical protein
MCMAARFCTTVSGRAATHIIPLPCGRSVPFPFGHLEDQFLRILVLLSLTAWAFILWRHEDDLVPAVFRPPRTAGTPRLTVSSAPVRASRTLRCRHRRPPRRGGRCRWRSERPNSCRPRPSDRPARSRGPGEYTRPAPRSPARSGRRRRSACILAHSGYTLRNTIGTAGEP